YRKAKSRQNKDFAMIRTILHRRRLPGLLVVFAALFASLIGSAAPLRAAGSISLASVGSPYTQNFDTLASSSTSSTVPAGWDFAEAGSGANTTYTAGTGSNNTGDTYSFGTTGERAFGMLQSGSLVSTIGASFTNNTGATITDLAISYMGEQWRL